MFADINWKLALSKFVKGAVFGAGSALFSIDLTAFQLDNIQSYQKLGLIALIALGAGALHGIWNVGKQYFFPLPTV